MHPCSDASATKKGLCAAKGQPGSVFILKSERVSRKDGTYWAARRKEGATSSAHAYGADTSDSASSSVIKQLSLPPAILKKAPFCPVLLSRRTLPSPPAKGGPVTSRSSI